MQCLSRSRSYQPVRTQVTYLMHQSEVIRSSWTSSWGRLE